MVLNNKKKFNLIGVVMEIMCFVVLVKLNVVESGIYKEVSVIKNEIFYFIDYSDWNLVKFLGLIY